MKTTVEELKEKQSWSLDQKILHSMMVVEAFLSKTNGMAYIGFSGGKDSTRSEGVYSTGSTTTRYEA